MAIGDSKQLSLKSYLLLLKSELENYGSVNERGSENIKK